ncbi:Crp/Fnr family transcriptional regulator [Campylobacterota bacterium DY0563]
MNLELLKKIDFFNLLNKNELELIYNSTYITTLKKNNILFYEGETAKSFYFLIQGSLKLYKIGTTGKEIIIHEFNKPTIVAEGATFQDSTFSTTAIITSKSCKIAIIEKEIMISILQKNTNFSFHIIKILINKMQTLDQTIHRNLVYDATQRICSILKENPNILVEEKLTEIANKINIAPATLSRSLKKLKDQGYLSNNNTIIDNSIYKILN